MKMVCNREGLLSACQLASVAVAARDLKPVLRNLKAVVNEDRCTLMATDLELGIRLDVRSIKVEEPGEALLPTARIIAILREATDEELTIEGNNDACFVRGQTNEFEMPGEDASIFPDIPAFAEEKYHEVTAGVIREMIRRTMFAPATADNAKFAAMTGILIELDNEKIRLVATDGRRLALMEGGTQAHGDHGTKGQMPVIPTKAMTLLERNLVEPDELVRISIRPNDALLKTERAMIYTRLVEGKYPDYKLVMPQKATLKIPLVVGPFQTAIRQAAIMTDQESKRVIFRFENKKLTLQARGIDAGRSRVEMPLDYSGSAVQIDFDPKFVLDMLKVLEPDAPMTLEVTDGKKPALFRVDANYKYVVVPLQPVASETAS